MLAIILPHMAALDTAAAELVEAAGDDRAAVNALNKAIWFLGEGLDIRPTSGAFLIPSGTRGGTVHRVSHVEGCSCEAGRAGRTCWHAKALAIVEQAQLRARPALLTMPEGDTLDTDGMRVPAPMGQRISAARAKAQREIDELF